MSTLFRREAIRERRKRLLGEVVISQPITIGVLGAFLCAIVAIAVAFLLNTAYARRETVVGVVVPSGGMVHVVAPRAAVVTGVHVAEGDPVAAGAALLTLAEARVTGNGVPIDEAVMASLDTQLREIGARREIEAERARRDGIRLEALAADLRRERVGLDAQLEAQRRRVQNAAEQHDRSLELAADGYVSSQDIAASEQNLLEMRQALGALAERAASADGRIRQAGLELERLPLELAATLSELVSTEEGIRIRKLELEGRGSIRIVAPVPGRVAAMQAVRGTTVDADTVMLTILPAGSELEAHLFVPSSAIGFVAPGQEAHLLYDAFDYRRFGVQRGIVAEVSAAAMAQPAGSGAVFRVRVRLERPSVRAYGRELPLQPGMTLRADIVLERQPVLYWWLEPLFGLRGRA
ncbi:MAG: HlyD family secretion protein [Gammaproteobacteria bacterium]|nr:HlyD family secretion protein [Gammaproteobacteria bacterium]